MLRFKAIYANRPCRAWIYIYIQRKRCKYKYKYKHKELKYMRLALIYVEDKLMKTNAVYLLSLWFFLLSFSLSIFIPLYLCKGKPFNDCHSAWCDIAHDEHFIRPHFSHILSALNNIIFIVCVNLYTRADVPLNLFIIYSSLRFSGENSMKIIIIMILFRFYFDFSTR